MRHMIVVAALVAAIVPAFGQPGPGPGPGPVPNVWTQNGTSIYSNNSGNVGIGTASPTHKLDVGGDANVNGELSSGSLSTGSVSGLTNFQLNGYGIVGQAASMSALSSYTASEMSFLGTINLQGYYAGSTLGGGTFTWLTAAQASGLTPDGGIVIAPSDHSGDCSAGCLIRQLNSGYVDPAFWGAYYDDTHDDATAIMDAIDYVKGTGKFGNVSFGPGTMKVGSGLTIDPTEVGFKCNGTLLDFASLSSGNALTIAHNTGGPLDTYVNAKMGIDGCSFQGSSASSGVVGIYSSGAFDTAHYSISNGYVNHFQVGFENSTNSYLVHFVHFDIYGNGTGVLVDSASNSGENISFNSLAIFGNVINMDLENVGALIYASEISMDYPVTTNLKLSYGQFNGSSVHFENSAQPFVYVPSSVTGYQTQFTCAACFVGQSVGSSSVYPFDIEGAANVSINGGFLAFDAGTTLPFKGNLNAHLNINGSAFSWSSLVPSNVAQGFSNFNFQPNYGANLSPGYYQGSFSVTTVGTYVTVPLNYTAGSMIVGLYVFRDDTNGGIALVSWDPTLGCTIISTSITNFACRLSSGEMQVTISTGTPTLPATYTYNLVSVVSTH